MGIGQTVLDARRARGQRLAFELETRPHVSAHSGPEIAARARREIERARRVLAQASEDGCAACPAAQMLGRGQDGLAVRCAVERSLVTERGDPSSLVNFCLAPAGIDQGYAACPSWQAEKEREWHGNRAPLVRASEGV